MKGARVSVKEAARVLGMAESRLRMELRLGNMPDIGQAVPHRAETGAIHYSYYVYGPKVLERVGLSDWPKKEAAEG